MNEKEFSEMVKSVREAESAIGVIDYNLTEKQKKGKDFSRSLYAIDNIEIGEVFSEKNVRSIRPGFGLHPKYLSQILGKRSNTKLDKGTRFDLKFLSE
jgi:pseudaminic acid synthase